MASPGLDVSDIIAACNYIYKRCLAYKDAIKEFDEISAKSKSTAVVVERLDLEAQKPGSLVERAGPQASDTPLFDSRGLKSTNIYTRYEQLQDNIRGLRVDSQSLKQLVKKYEKIQEMPARRLLFSFMESDNLTDLRRRIGLHEQTLNLWYMSLVYGSLRRIENGQEAVLDVVKRLERKTLRQVTSCLSKGDERPLEAELRKSGLQEMTIKDNLDVAIDYVLSPPSEKDRIETQVRTQSYAGAGDYRGRSYATNYAYTPEDPFLYSAARRDRSWVRMPPASAPLSDIRRRKSTGSNRPGKRHHERKTTHDDIPIVLNDGKGVDLPEPSYPLRPRRRKGPTALVVDEEPSRRPRRASATEKHSPQSPLLIVPDEGPRARQVAYRASSSRSPRRNSDADAGPSSDQNVYIIEHNGRRRSSSYGGNEGNEGRNHRRSSTHSDHRGHRPAGSAEREERDAQDLAWLAREIRKVTKMDRIDSMDV